MISDTALQEFIALWREEFGEEISEEKAMEIAPKLLNLFDHIYRPIKKKWLDENNNENANGKPINQQREVH